MDSNEPNKKQTSEERMKEMMKEIIAGILRAERDYPIVFPKRAKCNDCIYRIPGTARCSLLYPRGIPYEITGNKKECKEFKQI